jgi:hypothetical protein
LLAWSFAFVTLKLEYQVGKSKPQPTKYGIVVSNKRV